MTHRSNYPIFRLQQSESEMQQNKKERGKRKMSQTASEGRQAFTPPMKVYLEIRYREKQNELLTIDRIAEIFASLYTRREVIALVDQLTAQYLCTRSYGGGKPIIKTSEDSHHAYLSWLEQWKAERKATLNIRDA